MAQEQESVRIEYRSVNIGISSTILIVLAILALLLGMVVWFDGKIDSARTELRQDIKDSETRILNAIKGDTP
ncbi:MAG: hypothetical protein F4X82_03245 [Candidatus Spechtbacteria bacterium SB0662_bin_43]|uniref:Uncharacterized protein n=1 Tax=Candidatus Spechtbacteria bacterium SB0662_bin_43 TaxID=2604897 RepID=A0A845DAS0_9BACT|nr:hypothetical protein [Candidatus Spechtbacteria bacterium SB0662_bin_43]